LSPATISRVEMKMIGDKDVASVYLPADQVSLAIGKGGHNIKLASKLTGYDIDIYRDSSDGDDEDVDLNEFSDEIDQWIIDQLKAIGCDTAKSVLALSVSELEKRTDLEIETINEILEILRKEFEN